MAVLRARAGRPRSPQAQRAAARLATLRCRAVLLRAVVAGRLPLLSGAVLAWLAAMCCCMLALRQARAPVVLRCCLARRVGVAVAMCL